jgi:hypothetical protein
MQETLFVQQTMIALFCRILINYSCICEQIYVQENQK